MAAFSDLMVKIGADVSNALKGLSKLTAELDEAAQSFQEIGGTMTAAFTLPVIAAGAASIKFASDMQESLNKVNVAFGASSQDVLNWSKTSIEKMGLAGGSALDAAALFGDMATSMGISQQEAAKMSMRLTELGADLASFKNIPIEQAMTALNGVFTGETESLKMLGVVMTETQLKAFALSQGIQKSVDKMSQAEMVALRYAFVMDKTKNAQGDFARTSEGSANQMRMFQENLKELAVQFGTVLLPAFNKIIVKVNDLLKSFQGLSESTKQYIVVIAGIVAAIGPLLLGIGSLVLGFNSLVVAIRGVHVAFTALTAHPILLAITAIIGAIIGLVVITKKIINEWDNLSTTAKILVSVINPIASSIAYIVRNWDELLIKFKYGIGIIKNLSAEIAIFALDTLPLAKALGTLAIGQQEYNNLLDRYREIISQSKAANKQEYETKLNTIALEQLRAKQLEVAGTTEFISQKYVQFGNNAKVTTEATNNFSTGLEDNKKKASELAKELEKLRDVGINAANKLADQVKVALQNRVNEEEKTLSKLKDNLNKLKTNYDEMLKTERKFHDESIQGFRDASKKIIDEINNRYDDIQKAQEQGMEAEAQPYKRRIEMIQEAFKTESDALAESSFENEKNAILNEMMFNQTAENRMKATEKLADLMIKREAELLKDGRTLRIDEVWQLTKDENDIIKKRLNEARKLELDSLDLKVKQIEQNYAMEAVINEIRRQSELAKEQERLNKEIKSFEDIQKRKLELREITYQRDLEYFNKEIAASQNRYNLYNKQLEESNKTILDYLKSGNTDMINLLNEYNPKWKEAGLNFGQSLISGLEEKMGDIRKAVNKALEMINKATSPSVTTPTVKTMSAIDTNIAVSPNVNASQRVQDTNIYLDSKKVNSVLAPNFVDTLMLRNGYA